MKLCAFRQFVDSNGAPLAGGKIYTYTTGTFNAKATYTDSTGDSLHPNPVVLLSNGCNEIWLATDTAYRFVIKDSAGNQIGDLIDDITPVTTLAASTGGSNLDMTGYRILTTSGDLLLAPVSGSHVSMNGAFKFPTADGAATQGLLTNGAGQLYWGSASFSVLQDTLPVLGGDLNINGHKIIDGNSHNMFSFTATSSAVNYFDFANAATGNGVILSAVGTDTNIDLKLDAKGSGLIVANDQIKATAGITGPGSHVISDYTNSGNLGKFLGVASQTNYPQFTTSISGSPVLLAPIGGDTDIDLSLAGKGAGKVRISGLKYPTADSTAGFVVTTDGAGTLSLASKAPTMAAKSDMVAASSTTLSVNPARVVDHPGVPKVVGRCTLSGTGTQTLYNSYGMTSVTASGGASGTYTIVFATAFADANWVGILSHEKAYADSVGHVTVPSIGNRTTTGCTIQCTRVDAGGPADGANYFLNFAFYGAQ